MENGSTEKTLGEVGEVKGGVYGEDTEFVSVLWGSVHS